MMIALSKHLYWADKALRAGAWEARYGLIGRELSDKMLGLVTTVNI